MPLGLHRGGHDELIGTNEVYREIYEHGRFERAVAEQEVA